MMHDAESNLTSVEGIIQVERYAETFRWCAMTEEADVYLMSTQIDPAPQVSAPRL